MAGHNTYKMTAQYAIVIRDRDVIAKYDNKGGGVIRIGQESDTVGSDIIVKESSERSLVEGVPIDKGESWFQ